MDYLYFSAYWIINLQELSSYRSLFKEAKRSDVRLCIVPTMTQEGYIAEKVIVQAASRTNFNELVNILSGKMTFTEWKSIPEPPIFVDTLSPDDLPSNLSSARIQGMIASAAKNKELRQKLNDKTK